MASGEVWLTSAAESDDEDENILADVDFLPARTRPPCGGKRSTKKASPQATLVTSGRASTVMGHMLVIFELLPLRIIDCNCEANKFASSSEWHGSAAAVSSPFPSMVAFVAVVDDSTFVIVKVRLIMRPAVFWCDLGDRSKHATRRGAELLIEGVKAPHSHTSTSEEEDPIARDSEDVAPFVE